MNKLDEKIRIILHSFAIDLALTRKNRQKFIDKSEYENQIKHAVLSEIEKMEYTQIIDEPEYEKWINIENIRKLLGDKYE